MAASNNSFPEMMNETKQYNETCVCVTFLPFFPFIFSRFFLTIPSSSREFTEKTLLKGEQCTLLFFSIIFLFKMFFPMLNFCHLLNQQCWFSTEMYKKKPFWCYFSINRNSFYNNFSQEFYRQISQIFNGDFIEEFQNNINIKINKIFIVLIDWYRKRASPSLFILNEYRKVVACWMLFCRYFFLKTSSVELTLFERRICWIPRMTFNQANRIEMSMNPNVKWMFGLATQTLTMPLSLSLSLVWNQWKITILNIFSGWSFSIHGLKSGQIVEIHWVT